jgi:multiple sugar transport system permease protein
VFYTLFYDVTGLRLVNTYTGIIFTYSAFFIPMSIWILRGFFSTIPKELEEAALIDGCTPLTAFFKVILPSAWPGVMATGIYVFLLAWDELMFAWVLSTDIQTATIPVGIRLYVGQFGNRFDLLMAASTVATLPAMVLFFIMQKQIVSGLTQGAVKE